MKKVINRIGNATPINRQLARAITGGIIITGSNYDCPASDISICTRNLTFCNRYCQTNYGVSCQRISGPCP